ncbi:hypothetical protein [Enterococcus faecium]|uniref:hypothetical protein n=1 Tax=Enterococcus faecium TaxID=1352 RepID=UPI0009B373D5|nr:hypothetical protein [Enterococcus faecium]
MIGHSKGGAEAANSVAINTNAIIFNPATVNLSAYELDLYPSYTKRACNDRSIFSSRNSGCYRCEAA